MKRAVLTDEEIKAVKASLLHMDAMRAELAQYDCIVTVSVSKGGRPVTLASLMKLQDGTDVVVETEPDRGDPCRQF
jgi:hypothetical protein